MAEVIIERSTRAGDPIAHAGSEAYAIARAAETRALRALDLWRERGHEIVDLGDGTFAVPSQRGSSLYRVQYGEAELERCGCDDHKFNPGVLCKHILCVGIFHAKRRQRRLNFLSSLCAASEEED